MLPGEVYVRASLRTYASYLGIDADKVAEIRAHGGGGRAGPPSGRLGRVERMIAATRIRDNQRFLLVAAASILLVLLAFGLLSRGSAAPPAANPRHHRVADPGRPDDARRAGRPRRHDDRGRGGRGDLHVQDPAGETVALDALERLEFRVGDAGLVEVSVNGKDRTGLRGAPAKYLFTLGDAGGAPSSSG